MRELTGRLAGLDPDAGAALQVIAYFDRLVDARAGLESVVRGAAVLSAAAAWLHAPSRNLDLRVTPDGMRRDHPGVPAPEWCHVDIDETGSLWLERPGPAGPVEAMILERAALAARAVTARTRSRRPSRRELLEVLLDAGAPEVDRRYAARGLGVSLDARARVTATPDGRLDIVRQGSEPEPSERVGVGPPAGPLKLAATVEAARAAARFTAEGTASDPGPRVVYAESLGVLLVLAKSGLVQQSLPDVDALERASIAAPWMLATLDALARNVSHRAAATALNIHHSTLQERVTQAERHLGWGLHDVDGQMRLATALMARRIRQAT